MNKELQRQATGLQERQATGIKAIQGNIVTACNQLRQNGYNNVAAVGQNNVAVVGQNNVAVIGQNINYNDSRVINRLLDIISEQQKVINTAIDRLLDARLDNKELDISSLLHTLLRHNTKANG